MTLTKEDFRKLCEQLDQSDELRYMLVVPALQGSDVDVETSVQSTLHTTFRRLQIIELLTIGRILIGGVLHIVEKADETGVLADHTMIVGAHLDLMHKVITQANEGEENEKFLSGDEVRSDDLDESNDDTEKKQS